MAPTQWWTRCLLPCPLPSWWVDWDRFVSFPTSLCRASSRRLAQQREGKAGEDLACSVCRHGVHPVGSRSCERSISASLHVCPVVSCLRSLPSAIRSHRPTPSSHPPTPVRRSITSRSLFVMLRQVAARRRGRGLPLAWHSRPIGAAVHFLHTPSAAAASPAAASALSFVAPSPTPATPAHSRILRPSLILPSGVARAYTASNRPAAGEAAAAPASTSSESSSKVDLKTMLSRLDGPMPMAGDPRMLDCILVRHGESEGNIGQPGHKQKKRRVAVGSRSKQPGAAT